MTTMECIILGILADGAKSGYDVKRIFELSPSIGYSASAGAIYPALKRLESRELVEGKKEIQELRPNKKVYRLTDAGWAELVMWLKTPPDESDYTKVQSSVLDKLLFLDLLSKEDAIAFLQAAKKTVQAQLDRADEFNKAFGTHLGFFPQLLLESGVAYLRSQMALFEKALARLGDHSTRG